MGKIFYIMGKSSSGKDTVYKKLTDTDELKLHRLVIYTTRPVRDGEVNGREYYFTDEKKLEEFRKNGTLIEERTYQTVYGPWTYFTADDGQIQASEENYLGIGTLESYVKLRDYYGSSVMCPLYIQVEDGVRLERALNREKQQEQPKYEEMCRRFLADQKDFSEEKILEAGINRRFENHNLNDCVKEIVKYIKSVK